MPEAAQLVTFHLDSYSFGVDVRDVQEILRTRSLTPVPLADPSVLGLLNLRGQIVTVIDLKGRLQFPGMERASAENGMNVVARVEGGAVSFRVDSVGDVLDVDPTRLEPAAGLTGTEGTEHVVALYKLDDRVIHVVSAQKLADFSSRDSSDPRQEG